MAGYQALYRKYRPQIFDDVSGQLHVTETLKNQISGNKMSHAYLFTGSRGTGKTSCAKILSKAVNCLHPDNGNPCNKCAACQAIDSGSCMDVLEIDAASNNGVDNVRDLRDAAVYSPSQVQKRVYIIDEVHMLSIAAFNALLKLIEEPPEHLLFILATTELHKVPATILSRCQRFSFRRISQEDIAARLQFVAYQENIDLTESAARVLARMADGGMRDALSLLDQCASATNGELSETRIYECLGLAGEQRCAQMVQYISEHNTKAALELLNTLYAEGKDIAAIMDELGCLIRDLMVLKAAPKSGLAMLSGVATDKEALELVGKISSGELMRMLELVQNTAASFVRSASRRLDAELCIMELCNPKLSLEASALNARIAKLEEQIQSGVVYQAPVAAVPVRQPAEQAIQIPDAPAESSLPAPEAAQGQPVEDPQFWQEYVSRIRKEMGPPTTGFIKTEPGSPVLGKLEGDVLELHCEGELVTRLISVESTLDKLAQIASQMLRRPVHLKVIDRTKKTNGPSRMDQLINFGKEHSDIIHIK